MKRPVSSAVYRERLNHSHLQPVKLVKPRTFRENGRAIVRELQYVRGKGIGKSKSRRAKAKGKIQSVYNLSDSGKCRNSKECRLPPVVNTRKAKRSKCDKIGTGSSDI